MKKEKSRFFSYYFSRLRVGRILCNSKGLCADAISPEYVPVFNDPEGYDANIVYRVIGDDKKPKFVSDQEPDGDFNVSGSSITVQTDGLGSGTYRFAILTDEPNSETDIEYIAFGRFDVVVTSYILSVGNGGNGAGQIRINGMLEDLPYSGLFSSGTSVTLEAVAETDSRFINWSGDLSGSSNPISITMNEPKTINANFTQLFTLSLDKSGNGSGQIMLNGVLHELPHDENFNAGTIVELEAVPESGSIFGEWSGSLSGNQNPINITMNSDKDVTSLFNTLHSLTAHINPPEGGTIYANGVPLSHNMVKEYVEGDTAHLIATATFGYYFVGWAGDVAGSDNTTELIVDTNKSVTANFADLRYTLTASSNPIEGGTVTVDPHPGPDGKYAAGTVLTLSADASPGALFHSWSGSLSGSNNPIQITMNSNKSVSANFIGLANDYYVAPPPLGNDSSNNGIYPNTPFATIQHAINIATGTSSNPVTIHVSAGAYLENLNINNWESLEGGWNNNFTQRWDFEIDGITPTYEYETIVDAGNNGTVVTMDAIDQNVKLDGFTIRNGHNGNNYGGGILLSNASPKIANCKLENNYSEWGAGGIDCLDNSSPNITNCLITNNKTRLV